MNTSTAVLLKLVTNYFPGAEPFLRR